MTLQNLSLWDVAIAALLIVVNGAVSVALKLDLERKLAWAAVRTVVPELAKIDRSPWFRHETLAKHSATALYDALTKNKLAETLRG